MRKLKIYCAGPLFNDKEREEMTDIASSLETANFDVFLPHRDGIEFSKISDRLLEQGYQPKEANLLLSTAIFFIDTYKVADSDGLVINLNGRVPDEGAVVEAGIAWSLNIPVVIYKNDSRSKINGTDNPLVLGLSSFRVVNRVSAIVEEFNKHFSNSNNFRKSHSNGVTIPSFKNGKKLYRIFSNYDITKRKNINRLAKVLRGWEEKRGIENVAGKEHLR